MDVMCYMNGTLHTFEKKTLNIGQIICRHLLEMLQFLTVKEPNCLLLQPITMEWRENIKIWMRMKAKEEKEQVLFLGAALTGEEVL